MAVAVFGAVEEPPGGWEVSSRVIVRPEGIFPDPLCFRRLDGPLTPVGEAGLDRFRGVSVVEVLVPECGGIANVLDEVMG